jgi:hypothetical protein
MCESGSEGVVSYDDDSDERISKAVVALELSLMKRMDRSSFMMASRGVL